MRAIAKLNIKIKAWFLVQIVDWLISISYECHVIKKLGNRNR